jgi:hypothetical protein
MTGSGAVRPSGGQIGRRFSIGDAMTLVAAVAVGLALAKVAFDGAYPSRLHAIECGPAAAFFCVASLSAAFIPLRLRRPRPPLVRVIRQPGAVACGTAIAMLGVGEVSVVNSAGGPSLSQFALVLSPVTGDPRLRASALKAGAPGGRSAAGRWKNNRFPDDARPL